MRDASRAGLLLLVSAPIARAAVSQEAPPRARLEPVPLEAVEIRDAFWAPRREVNRTVSLPHGFAMLEKSGNVRNLELAAAGAREGFTGYVFQDSDVYKMIEAASFALATDPDPALEARVEALIAKIAAAQRPDGYLDTALQIRAPDRCFTNLRDQHELYCAGHLFEAAVAHFQATGRRTLLDVALRFAELLAGTFGSGAGQRMGYPGHPEVELALVKLWRATGDGRWFDLARFFVEHRGGGFFAREHGTPLEEYDGRYWQDDVPIAQHRSIQGHAVRAGYLFAGVTDVVRETGDPALLAMLERVWRNATQKRLYVTGGMGPSAHNEGFTTDYDLPNVTAYQETCASIALVLWNHRLNLLHGDARYADLVELGLYNAVLAGAALDGRRWFYVNPLASQGRHHRSEWFACACCPPNVARILASLGGYAYATGAGGLWVNLYVAGGARAKVGEHEVALRVSTDSPWDGRVELALEAPQAARFALHLRVPGWCPGPRVEVNGEAVEDPPVERGYLVLEREWQAGDRLRLDLPMPVRRIAAHPRVAENRGRLAFARGPLIYCFEQCDQDVPLAALALPLEAELEAERVQDLLDGVVVLRGEGLAAADEDWRGVLYRVPSPPRRVAVTAVPYYAWDNREAGAMQVWMPVVPAVEPPGGPERDAEVSLSFVSKNCDPAGVHDGKEPKSSAEHPGALCHFWPHKGGTEWVQYTFAEPFVVDGARVYFFDDTGRGECRLPLAWRILHLQGEEWQPVAVERELPVRRDAWCEARFAPVRTSALRLEVTMQPEWAAGIHEWQVLGPDD